MSKDDLIPKYRFLSKEKTEEVLNKCQDDDMKQYIKQLISLIGYQKSIIDEQIMTIVAIKHKLYWKET